MKHIELTLNERKKIKNCIENGKSIRQIAKFLEKAHSTVVRELKKFSSINEYDPFLAQENTVITRKRCGAKTKVTFAWSEKIESLLNKKWSPEQIVNRGIEHQVCTQTLYNWLNQRIIKFPLEKLRHKNKRQKSRESSIWFTKGFRSIHERPEIVTLRQELGHFEIDAMVSSRGESKGCLLTLTERKTRLHWAFKMPNRLAEIILTTLKGIPDILKKMMKTITSDRGSEFSKFHEIENDLNISFYVADPYSSHQRWSNENSNGLIREYYPKKTDFLLVDESELVHNLIELNSRPRKCLNWRSPIEVFQEEVVQLIL
ncbi:IS30 family transposase [Williamsoniiplasma luminosum]|uniref:IS30 family transposase n=1 Tax=Williamsoniiplasma luminosum TaxID=214888 RepID=A0A2S0NKG2_9MOLU|nr:IS30 family transposase [Williamsoniiplasma luminosum]AVP49513.1 MAG: IS30 family transposase [Williamsoniiplasma luminosum]